MAPNRAPFRRRVVEYRPASALLPVDDRGHALLIRHYRHPVGRLLWEIPGGMIQPGESPVEAAVRETHEETGYRIGRVEALLGFHPEPAFTDHWIELFAGFDLRPDRQASALEFETSAIGFFCAQEVRDLVTRREIASSWSLLAVMDGLTRGHLRD